ncbi:MAG: DNA (cytosine-5-)-methyltransferase [Deltaproteobacteria bacterium]|nr:DNA (cytosine-5-)-methyltransferase [Deltaproteobacteria bacterium]
MPHPSKGFRVAGLFAGIGGIEHGLHLAGHETKVLCEIEPGACAVLAKRFPGVPIHRDVCDLEALPRDIDLLTAGFPCQDLSQAGKTVGIEGTRSGLVGEVFRLLRRRPTPWVLLENVPFMLQLSRGRAMEVIVASLEHLGYRWAYRVVTTQAFGLPQRRERVYLLASLHGDPREVLFADEAGEPPPPEHSWKVANGFYWTEGVRGLGWAVDAVPTLKGGSTIGIPSPPAIVLPEGRVVTPELRDAERMQGFDPDWTSPAEDVTRKSHRWKLVGNAVTVDVARWVGERLANPSPRGALVEGTPLEGGERAWPKAAWNVGDGRFAASISKWPFQRPGTSLERFLKYPSRPLSTKATAGFLARTKTSSLRFPPGFIKKLERHLAAATKADEGRQLSLL